MKDCETCKWNTNFLMCKQGHYRLLGGDVGTAVENCHGWEEKKEGCKCRYPMDSYSEGGNFYYTLGSGERFLYKPEYCPRCGRKL